jgi:hypothetical protein
VLLEHPRRRRRREHDVDLVFLDDLPPDAGVRTQRRSLVHDGAHAGDQRTVDDVGVADDPADVGGCEIGLAFVAAIDVLDRRRQGDRVTAGVPLYAFRLAGGAGGVEDVRRLGGLQPGDRHLGVHEVVTQRGVIDVATLDLGEVLVEAPIDHQHFGGLVFGQRNRFVEQTLVGNGPAAAHAGIRRDDQLRGRVVDPGGQRPGGKATEDHRVNGANPRAGEHGEHCLGDHRHVDQDAVTLADAQALHDRRHAHDFLLASSAKE